MTEEAYQTRRMRIAHKAGCLKKKRAHVMRTKIFSFSEYGKLGVNQPSRCPLCLKCSKCKKLL